MLPQPLEWPWSYESSIPTCVSGLAPWCFFGVGGSTLGHGAINQIYQLWEDNSEEYQALFVATDFESLKQELTQGMWQRHPSTSEFTTFPMTALTPVANVWYNFLCVKIKPSLHLSTMKNDKTILLYALTKGF